MISGTLVELSPLDRIHAERTRNWANDAELCRLLDRATPVADSDHDQWFSDLQNHPDRVYFAIEVRPEKKHIGNVWLWDIDQRHRKAELRIVIGDRSSFGKGAGSESIDLTCEHAFRRLNLHRVYAYVLEINQQARRAFEKAGFSVEGTLRQDRWVDDRYVDVFVLGRLR